MSKINTMIPIEYGKYYHIFNRGNNHENIFKDNSDYLHFLDLTDTYISCVADIFAWVLLKNHFHLLVRIKEEEEIGFLNSENASSGNLKLKWKTYFLKKTILYPSDESMSDDMLLSDAGKQISIENLKFTKKPNPHQQFKHLFNTYSKRFNIKYDRTGSLLTKNYKRKQIDNENYLKNLIVYIHNNPVLHEFTERISDYKWSSYHTIISTKTTKLFREEVLEYFDNRNNFIFVHKQETDFDDIEDFLIE